MPKGWSNKTLQLMASISFFFHESRLRGMFFITINEIKIQITKYITKYITNHNTNRDLEMKIRTFTEIVSYISFILCITKLGGTSNKTPTFSSKLNYFQTKPEVCFICFFSSTYLKAKNMFVYLG